MGVYLSAAEARALAANQARRSVFFHLESDPVLYLWAGVGDIEAPMRSVSVLDQAYIGGGQFANVPDLAALLDGGADRVEFMLSGVNADAAARVAEEAPSVCNAILHVGLLAFDEEWQPATEIVPISRLRADYVALRQDPAASRAGPPVSALILSCHMGDVTQLTRPTLSYYTPAHQKRRDPDDTSCDHIFLLQQGYDVVWPRF